MKNVFVRSPASGTSNVTLNAPLLVSALVASVAFLALHIAAISFSQISFLNFILNFLAFIVLVLTLVYCVYELYWQTALAWQNRQAISALCASAFLGCFLFGLISLAFANISIQNIGGSGLDLALCILSLVGLLLLLTRSPSKATLPPAMSHPPPPPIAVLPPIVVDPSVKYPGGNPPPEAILLSLRDLLNEVPQPHKASFLTISKTNEHIIYNEDACVISQDETLFALCDGVTNSELPRGWAILLGRQWLKNPLYPLDEQEGIDAAMLLQWLKEPRLLWRLWVKQVWRAEVNQRNLASNKPPVLDEQVESILNKGAAATFLGLQLDHDHMRWRATAIGDTCLFLISTEYSTSARQLIPLMPITSSALFNRTPALLSSKTGRVERLLPKIQYQQGTYNHGDTLLMATDALARWLIVQVEQGLSEWQTLVEIRDLRSFSHFIEERRSQKANKIEKDDTTLVVIPL